MAMTVTVDVDDLAYLAELAKSHLVELGWPADNEVACAPIYRTFLTLEDHAPRTFAHQYDLWAVPDEIDNKGGAW